MYSQFQNLYLLQDNQEIYILTRMHSSRKRTARFRGDILEGGVCLDGVCVQGECLPRGVCPGWVSAWGVCVTKGGVCVLGQSV